MTGALRGPGKVKEASIGGVCVRERVCDETSRKGMRTHLRTAMMETL